MTAKEEQAMDDLVVGLGLYIVSMVIVFGIALIAGWVGASTLYAKYNHQADNCNMDTNVLCLEYASRNGLVVGQ